MDERPGQRFFWTKVWGAPGAPEDDALTFAHPKQREDALALLRPGDVVVFLTSDVGEADPVFRGLVSGAVEIEGERITAEELGLVAKAPPSHRNKTGEYRWPWGITISRAWRAVEKLRNDEIAADHARLGLHGAATVHPLEPSGMGRVERLRMEEVTRDGASAPKRLIEFRPRPPRQVAGPRAGGEVDPGTELYVAVLIRPAVTFKIGSGHAAERLRHLNHYRRPFQGEDVWSIPSGLTYRFETPDAARDAEDHLLEGGKARGFGSPDNSEFLICGMNDLKALFNEAVEHGRDADARHLAAGGETA